MIGLSDNTATNLLIARLGTASVNARLDTYGLTSTACSARRSAMAGRTCSRSSNASSASGMTTPREMAKLMALIAAGRAVNADASDAMLATLRRQQDRAMIPRLLTAEGVEVGNKTGTDEEKQPGPRGLKGQVEPTPPS